MKQQVSAGGIVFRSGSEIPEIALIRRATRKGEPVWCLPKGLMHPDETHEETARREVREETGLEGAVKEKLGEIQYRFYSPEKQERVQKTVHFFLMEYLRGSVKDHDHEVQEAAWFPIPRALELLVYESERDLVQKAASILQH